MSEDTNFIPDYVVNVKYVVEGRDEKGVFRIRKVDPTEFHSCDTLHSFQLPIKYTGG